MEKMVDDNTDENFSRHANQIAVSGFGIASQRKLQASRVLILGSGPVALALSGSLLHSGIGTIKIIDSNLAKLNSLRYHLDDLNSTKKDGDTVCLCQISYQLVESMAVCDLESLVNSSDLVVEVLTDWQEKLSLSDVCMSARRPLLHCGGSGMRFQLFAMVPGQSCCLRCLLASLGLEDAIGGQSEQAILTPLAGLIGNALSLAAVKMLSGFGASQSNEIIKIDGLSGELEVLRGFDFVRDCPDCGSLGGSKKNKN